MANDFVKHTLCEIRPRWTLPFTALSPKQTNRDKFSRFELLTKCKRLSWLQCVTTFDFGLPLLRVLHIRGLPRLFRRRHAVRLVMLTAHTCAPCGLPAMSNLGLPLALCPFLLHGFRRRFRVATSVLMALLSIQGIAYLPAVARRFRRPSSFANTD